MQEASKERGSLSNEVGLNAAEAEEGHVVEEELTFMTIFLDAFLLHPGFGRLMRGFNMWNVISDEAVTGPS